MIKRYVVLESIIVVRWCFQAAWKHECDKIDIPRNC